MNQPNETKLSLIERTSNWYASLPSVTRKFVALSFFSTIFLIAGWAKHLLFTPAGAFISFGTSAIASLLSLIALFLGGVIPMLCGFCQLAFKDWRKYGLITFLWSWIPIISYFVIMWILVDLKGIDFD